MTSIQLLAQNLLYDISQIAIPWDRVDEEYLTQPRRWNARGRFPCLSLWTYLTSSRYPQVHRCPWSYKLSHRHVHFFSQLVLLRHSNYRRQCQAGTNTLVPARVSSRQHSSSRTTDTCNSLLTQTLIVHLLRTAKFPIIQSRAAPILVFSTASIMAIGFVLPWIPAFRPAFSFAQPAPTFVGFLAAELLLYAVEVQVVKIIYIKVFGTWL